MKANVVVSGGAGLAGSYIVKNLVDKGHKVTVLVREGSDISLLAAISDKIHYVQAPLEDITALALAITPAVTHVIHAAAVVSFWPKTRPLMYKTNVEGTANLVNICIKNPTLRFCYISSVAVLGGKNILETIDETATPDLQNLYSHYAKSKYLAENQVWRGIAEGLSAVIINPSIILGAGNTARGSTAIFDYVMGQHTYYPPGQLNYIDARDLAEICVRLLFSDAQAQRFVASGGTISYKTFFEMAAKKFGKKAPHKPISKPLAQIAWRLAALKAYFDHKQPLITKETAHSAFSNVAYSSSKLLDFLPIEFTNLEDTLHYISKNLKNKI